MSPTLTDREWQTTKYRANHWVVTLTNGVKADSRNKRTTCVKHKITGLYCGKWYVPPYNYNPCYSPHVVTRNTYHMQNICYCWCIVIYFCSSIYLVADIFLHRFALENTWTKIYVIADMLEDYCSNIYLVADMFLHLAPTTPHKLAQGEDDGSARSKKMGRADQCQDIWNWTSQIQANTVKYRHEQLTQIQIQ